MGAIQRGWKAKTRSSFIALEGTEASFLLLTLPLRYSLVLSALRFNWSAPSQDDTDSRTSSHVLLVHK